MNVLRRFAPDIPADPRAVHDLLDDLGIEVKARREAANDTLFEVELLANRGDHRCYQGIARELAVRTRSQLAPLDVCSLGGLAPPAIHVNIETPLCLNYSITPFTLNSNARPLHAEHSYLLNVAEAGPVFPIIDATNVVGLEIGQHTHAFDAEAVEGTIRVRESLEGEIADPLFSDRTVQLPPGTIVVADNTKLLAIAGIVGCKAGSVHGGTRNVLIESACFDPVAIRKASKSIGISTAASQRFERGADPAASIRAVERLARLVQEAGTAHATSAPWVWNGAQQHSRTISISISEFNNLFDSNLAAADASDLLTRYGYTIEQLDGDTFSVEVPSWRVWDVTTKWSVFEEIARLYSFSALPETAPAVQMGSLPSLREDFIDELRQYFVGQGLFEVFSDSFYGHDTRQRLHHAGAISDRSSHVEILNSLDRSYSLLRNNCLGHALSAVNQNARYKQKDLRFFEVCKTFHPDPAADNGVCREREVVWVLLSGATRPHSWIESDRSVAYADMSGLLDGLIRSLRLNLSIRQDTVGSSLASALHPYRQSGLYFDDELIGVFGEVHPSICREFDVVPGILFCELEIAALAESERRPLSPRVPGPHEPSTRALNFVLRGRVEAGTVQDILCSCGPESLIKVDVQDVYFLRGSEAPTRSITYQLVFRQSHQRLSAEEINQELHRLASLVESHFPDGCVILRREEQ